jgi:predicted enzyme related to lactoylglutathione lyase
MKQSLALISLLVRDYDIALSFFLTKLSFELLEDTPIPSQSKRWVVIKPPGSSGCNVLLAKASTPEQESHTGNQTGGRVFLFLYTDDFARDYESMMERGVKFVREPKKETYGTVAVFEDCEGNLWDLLEPSEANRSQ